ncbi:MAG: methionine--tRNA ligase [Deltaproteobacteria bacterium]|nr:methionine--tRNA ligase [Deltaproteobacteria bacterium]
MKQNQRRLLITSALPYANGDIHLGHMVEHMTTDFWARFQKMQGHECLSVCADDTHGAPIMVEARKQGRTPEEQIELMHRRHVADMLDFQIAYDNYFTTHSELNRSLSDKIYLSMKEQGHIFTQTVRQAYCEQDQMFLPDRFVKGTCPRCHAANQYGDSCDVCSSVYNPLEMENPECSLCQSTPVEKESEHHFCRLSAFRSFLSEWVPGHTPEGIAKKLSDWLGDEQLQDWCLTRDKPYFGFELPDAPGKYYYVWFDAPVGYIASTWDWCRKNKRQLEEFWNNEQTEIYHNIGKDIIYFHTLFWPVMLKTAGFQTPKKIMVHGMLTVNGEKMSKSRGTFITARAYLNHLPPEFLRYYMACKLNGTITDIDLNWDDFISRVNSDLVGKITNIASRSAQLLQKNLDRRMSVVSEDGLPLLTKARDAASVIADYYENGQFSKAILLIRDIADMANKYFDDHTPWKLLKEDPEKTREILTTALNLFRCMAIYLKPVLPSWSAAAETLFQEEAWIWDDHKKNSEHKQLAPFSHLLSRIAPEKVAAILDESREQSSAPAPSQKAAAGAVEKSENQEKTEALAAEISIDDFLKVDLRVARILKASYIEGASKLLQLSLDLGPLGQRNVFAGIRSAYEPGSLEGRLIVVVANLKARKMRFGTSEGMLLAAGSGGTDLQLLSPDSGARPGMRIG